MRYGLLWYLRTAALVVGAYVALALILSVLP